MILGGLGLGMELSSGILRRLDLARTSAITGTHFELVGEGVSE